MVCIDLIHSVVNSTPKNFDSSLYSNQILATIIRLLRHLLVLSNKLVSNDVHARV